MKSRLLAILLVILLPLAAFAQRSKHSNHKHTHTAPQKNLPSWAAAHNYMGDAHAYFPDYYTFYDANRGGYVFWDHDKWTFTPTMPPYLQNKDLAKSRVQILKGLSLDLQPQQNYPRYMKLYPPVPGAATDVPVPTSAP